MKRSKRCYQGSPSWYYKNNITTGLGTLFNTTNPNLVAKGYLQDGILVAGTVKNGPLVIIKGQLEFDPIKDSFALHGVGQKHFTRLKENNVAFQGTFEHNKLVRSKPHTCFYPNGVVKIRMDDLGKVVRNDVNGKPIWLQGKVLPFAHTDSVYYTGDCNYNNLPHGTGTIKNINNDFNVFSGTFEDGKPLNGVFTVFVGESLQEFTLTYNQTKDSYSFTAISYPETTTRSVPVWIHSFDLPAKNGFNFEPLVKTNISYILPTIDGFDGLDFLCTTHATIALTPINQEMTSVAAIHSVSLKTTKKVFIYDFSTEKALLQCRVNHKGLPHGMAMKLTDKSLVWYQSGLSTIVGQI